MSNLDPIKTELELIRGLAADLDKSRFPYQDSIRAIKERAEALIDYINGDLPEAAPLACVFCNHVPDIMRIHAQRNLDDMRVTIPCISENCPIQPVMTTTERYYSSSPMNMDEALETLTKTVVAKWNEAMKRARQ